MLKIVKLTSSYFKCYFGKAMIFLYIRLKDNYAPNKLKTSNFYQEKIVHFKFW